MSEPLAFNPEYLTRIARVCHEANRSHCESHNDFSQKSWDEAEEWQRESAMKGVAFAINNPDAPESAQHDAWARDKYNDGWVYGDVKDPAAKTHPCLVPFTELPFHQQQKDKIFRKVVRMFSQPRRGLSFGEAIEALQSGKRIGRAGWNGKGMFVVLMPELKLPPYNTAGTTRKVNDRTAKWIGEDQPLDCQPYLAMYNAQKQWQPGWLASQTDMLANDWEILPE